MLPRDVVKNDARSWRGQFVPQSEVLLMAVDCHFKGQQGEHQQVVLHRENSSSLNWATSLLVGSPLMSRKILKKNQFEYVCTGKFANIVSLKTFFIPLQSPDEHCDTHTLLKSSIFKCKLKTVYIKMFYYPAIMLI